MNSHGKPLEVFLVEDSQEDVFFFRRALTRSRPDAVLHVALNGREAVDALNTRRFSPDVVFLDLKLPLVSGFEILRWAREHRQPGRIPIIVLSGSPYEKDRSQAFELGAADYLVKPVSTDTLRDKLSWVASRRMPAPNHQQEYR